MFSNGVVPSFCANLLVRNYAMDWKGSRSKNRVVALLPSSIHQYSTIDINIDITTLLHDSNLV